MNKRTSIILASIGLLVMSFMAYTSINHTVFADEPKQFSQPTTNIYDKTIYRVNQRLVMNDLVNGDLYCVADNAIIDEVVNGDVMCLGNTVTLKGTINNNARIIAQNIVLDGTVAGNATLIGSDIRINKDAAIAGDATVVANTLQLSGTVGRDVTIRAKTVNISGTIDRDVYSYHRTMTITDSAQLGTITYSSPQALEVPAGTVSGQINQIATNAPTYLSSLATGTVFLAALLYIAWFISLIITALGVAFLFPKSLEDSVVYAKKQPWISALAGVMTIVVTPLGIALLLTSIVGIPLAFIVGFLFGAVLLLSSPFVAHFLGSLFFPYRSHPIRSLVGAVLLLLLYVIPVVNIIAFVVATIFGTGLVVRIATERYSIAASSYKKRLQKT